MSAPSFWRSDQWVKATIGTAITGAHVYWLNQPSGTIPPFEPKGGPPNQAATYTDSSGQTTAPQPIITDGFGHCDTYLAPGIYTVAVYLNGSLTNYYADQSTGNSVGVTSLNGLQGAVVLQAGSNITFTTVGNTINIAATSQFPAPSATLPGDILRYNVKGDGTWDSVGYPVVYDGVVANYVNVSAPVGLYTNIAPSGVGGEAVTGVQPTLATPYNQTTYSLNVASTSTTIGLYHAENGNNGLFHIRSFWRMTHKLLINAVANSRYYWGIGVWANGSSLGTNGTNLLGTTAFATDTPNHTFVGWRWSSGTDANFKIIVIQAGASATTVLLDTGVPVDSNAHQFDVTLDPSNTTYTFYLDGNQVGTVAASTITFSPTNPSDALGSIMFCGDGKNTTTNIWITFSSMFLSLRQ